MNARYYLPDVGRFVSADTIVPEATDPQGYNRYSYAYNNPVKYSDPTGHLSEDEIKDYFGFQNRQEMFDAGWVEELVNWLWDPDVTWGDVFSYNDGAGEAMLVLLEERQRDSGLYRGIFWGINGEDKGEEVYRSQIESLDDHTQAATALEEFYQGQWENLPKQSGSDGYNNYDPTTYVDALTVGTVSASASIGGLFFISGPGGWVAAGISIIGGGTAIHQVATDNLTAKYPVLRLPAPLGNAPRTWHAFRPRGFYE